MQTQEVELTSLSLAAFLLTKKEQLLRIRHASPQSFFVFLNTPELEQLVNQFNTLASQVEPQAYFGNLRLLRRTLYTGT